MHTARLFLARLSSLTGNQITDEQKAIVLVAALLHDTGHGPFSHAFESVTSDKHENRTREIIEDESTEANNCLRNFNENLPQQVATFFWEDSGNENGSDVPAYLTHVVSSQFDADRSDYLLRDCHAAGITYGLFDLHWLIDHMNVDKNRGNLVLDKKAFHGAEQYVFARYHMYQSVYFHKATRSAEVMLRLLFQRFKKLLSDGESKVRPATVANAPPALVKTFSEALSLEDYLQLDDATIMEFFKSCTTCDDPIMARLADGLLNRRLYKCIDASRAGYDQVRNFERKAEHAVQSIAENSPVEYFFATDTPADTPYKIYEPAEDNPATQILIETSSGKIKPINHVSEQVNALRNQITQLRFYFPEKSREKVQKVAKNTLK